MGYLIHVLLALATLGAAEMGLELPGESAWLLLPLTGVPHLLALFDRKLALRGRFRQAEFVYRVLASSGAGLFAVAVLVFGWAKTVERWFGEKPAVVSWPNLAVLAALVPFVVYELLAIDAKARLADSRIEEIARTRRLQVRFLFSSLAPITGYVLATSAIGLSPWLRAQIEHVAVWGGVFALLLLALTIAILPRLLRATWDTSPLPPGRERALLESFARSIGFRCRELVKWHTGFQVANAAVVGLGRGKLVLFSDLLLSQLPERELLAVFAHEIGHVARRHVPVFVAWSIAFFVAVDLSLSALGLADEWLGLALLGAALGLWYLGFGLLSRRTELEADVYSVSVTGDVEGMIAALERVGSPHTRALGTWRHFSTAKRIDFLRRAQHEPWLAERLTRRLRWIGNVGLVLGALALGAEAWNLSRSYRKDTVRAALSLGDGASAARALEALAEPDPALARLVVVANADAYRAVNSERLVEFARAARANDELQLALDLYLLAQLRGVAGLEDSIGELVDALRPRDAEKDSTSDIED